MHGKAIGYPTPYDANLSPGEQIAAVDPTISLMGKVTFPDVNHLTVADAGQNIGTVSLQSIVSPGPRLSQAQRHILLSSPIRYCPNDYVRLGNQSHDCHCNSVDSQSVLRYYVLLWNSHIRQLGQYRRYERLLWGCTGP